MSEDNTNSNQQPEQQGGAGGQGGQVLLERLYLKDVSFESPRSPAVFTEAWKPDYQLDINTRTNALGNDRFEVVLGTTLRAKTEGGKTAYIVEIQQAGVFQLKDLDDQSLQRVLATLCAGTLFPYVRETVDNLVVKGGFPAVHLAPVNFEALYADALRKRGAEQAPPAVPH
ncbi:MAG: protein-export chaperone SecB [Pseudomonadales bacterium]